MSSGLEQSPAVSFRSSQLPAGNFAGVDALPAALTALDSAQRPPPSELTILAQRLNAVHIASPGALQAVATKLDFGDENAGNAAAKIRFEPQFGLSANGTSQADTAADGRQFTQSDKSAGRQPFASLSPSLYSQRSPQVPAEHKSIVQILFKDEERATTETLREEIDELLSEPQQSPMAAPVILNSHHSVAPATMSPMAAPAPTAQAAMGFPENAVTPSRTRNASERRRSAAVLPIAENAHGTMDHVQLDARVVTSDKAASELTKSSSLKQGRHDDPKEHPEKAYRAECLASPGTCKDRVSLEARKDASGTQLLGITQPSSRESEEHSPEPTANPVRSGLTCTGGEIPGERCSSIRFESGWQKSPETSKQQTIGSALQAHMDILSGGISHIGWREWAEALDTITKSLGMDTPSELIDQKPSQDVILFMRDRRNLLRNAVWQSIGEIRPTILASTFMLIDALITRHVLAPAELSEQAVDKLVETASGASVNGLVAAKCLIGLLATMPDLPLNFKCEDSAAKLRAACSKIEGSVLISHNVRENLRIITGMLERLNNVRDSAANSHATERSELKISELMDSASLVSHSTIHGLVQHREAICESVSTPVQNIQPHPNSPRPGSSGRPPRPNSSNPKSRHTPKSGLTAQPVTPILSRAAEGLEQASSNKQAPSFVDSPTPDCSVIVPSTHCAKEDENGDRRLSTKKITPVSQRKKRLYTQEELDEARRVALRQAMETAKEMHAEECNRMEARKKHLESHNDELQIILGQYEETMTVMVEKEKSAATSSQLVEAESEIGRLKAELLEVTDAFDKLKQRYDKMKALSGESEVRETRLVEQNRELKMNMVELQKWSNDLKTNTEKKLSSSFEAASKFRTMYLDKEAREAKAVEKLQVAQEELVQREDALAEAMVKIGQLEEMLATAEDAAKSRENATQRAKAELGEAASKLSQLKLEISDLRRQLAKAEDASTRLESVERAASLAETKLKAIVTENQSLKVRAYDDLTRIKELENDINAKSKEVDELNSICEELLGKLESGK
jgi:hypothetical protein